MTGKLTPFSYNVGTIYHGFFNRHVYQPPPTPRPRYPPPPPGSRKQKMLGLNRDFNSVFLERLETAVEMNLTTLPLHIFVLLRDHPSFFL